MGAFEPLCLLTLGCVGLLLWGHAHANRSLIWAAKPAASSGFVMAALAAGAWDSAYGRWVLLAQAFGWAGDVLLIPKNRTTFLLGMVTFMLGHLLFAAAFLSFSPLNASWGATALALLSVTGGLAHRWMMPSVPRAFKAAVRAYIVVISGMVAAAAAACAAHPHPGWLLCGSVLFYLSDLCVARQRFVHPGFINQALGLPLYYVAQLILAATVLT